MVSEGEAFCPGHVTAFFEVVENPNPRAKGSRGAGLSLSLGVQTVAKARDASPPAIDILVNERRRPAEVTRRAVEKMVGPRRTDSKILRHTPLPVPQASGPPATAAPATWAAR